MRTQPETAATPTHVPLARDSSGMPFDVPEEAVAWRVRRHTKGRPRLQLDAKKQPMELPLTYTVADLEEILAPGTYRLDLVDAGGSFLEVTVTISLGDLRNAASPARNDSDEEASHVPSLPAHANELRFIVEANVRAMQMAFAHNERMLASSLRVVDTLRDGVQALATAQADWIKATAPRGFLRNGSTPQVQVVAAQAAPEDDEADEEDEDEDEAPTMQSQFVEMATAVAPVVVTAIIDRFMNGGTAAPNAPTAAQPTAGFEARDLFDWQHAAKKAKKKREVIEVPPSPKPAIDLAALAKEIPPGLLPRVMQVWQGATAEQRAQLQRFLPRLLEVRARLSPDEQQQLLPLVLVLDPEGLTAMATQLERLDDDALVAKFRTLLEEKA